MTILDNDPRYTATASKTMQTIPDPTSENTLEVLATLKEAVETLGQLRGDTDLFAVTFRDLQTLGVIEKLGNGTIQNRLPFGNQTENTRGTLKYCDGVTEDYGSGEGWYVYKSDGWYFMADLSVDGAWEDLTTELANAQEGGTAPTAVVVNGGPYKAYRFSATGQSLQSAFHIKHDIKRGSVMYPHVHWTTGTTNTGSVTWRLSYQVCQGHDQANFPAASTIDLTQAAAGTAWRHMIVEGTNPTTQGIPAPEVDSVILIDIQLLTNTLSGGDDPFALFLDLHYQRERLSTKQKAPDFYAD